MTIKEVKNTIRAAAEANGEEIVEKTWNAYDNTYGRNVEVWSWRKGHQFYWKASRAKGSMKIDIIRESVDTNPA